MLAKWNQALKVLRRAIKHRDVDVRLGLRPGVLDELPEIPAGDLPAGARMGGSEVWAVREGRTRPPSGVASW
jgi:hypothetical protein